MADALAASILGLLGSLELGAFGQDTANHFSIEGLTSAPRPDGALDLAIRRFDAAALRLACGPFVLEIGRLALHQVAGQLRNEEGKPRLRSLHAARAELFGVKVQGPVVFSREAKADSQAPPAGMAWCLGPLGTAEGTLRAKIVDAHLLFDADVTVPIRQGRINFNEASVEHVGPDSRMGVSRLGLYVDAPNGRSYLFQFASAPLAGVEFEKRGAMLGPWVTDRGRLQLESFGEALLRQGPGRAGIGFTEQARLLFERTAVSGELRLGDAKFVVPGVHGELAGRAEGRNAIRVHSEAVGRSLTAEMPSLLVRHAVLNLRGTQVGCDEISGMLVLRVFREGAQLRFAFDLGNVKLAGLRLQPQEIVST